MTRGATRLAPALAALGLAFGYHLLRTSWVSGDGAIYAAAIRDADFWTRPIHLGYYAFGWALTAILSPLKWPLEDVLVLGNALLCACVVVVQWAWARELGVPRRAALVSAGALALSGNILNQATGVEVYALALLLLMLSLWALAHRRPMWAGLAFGGALLVTPLTAMAGGYLAWAAVRQRRLRTFVVAAVPAVVLLGALLVVSWKPYMFGQRGLLVTGAARVMRAGLLGYNLFALVKNFLFASAFLPVGLWISSRRKYGLAWLLGLLLVMHLPVLLGMAEEGVFILMLYPLLALLMGLGADAVLSRLGRPAAPALAALALLQIAASLYVWVDVLPDHRRQDFYRVLVACPPGSTLVGSWDQHMAANYYAAALAPARPTYGVFQEEERLTAGEFRDMLAARGEVYVLEDYSPSRVPRQLLPGPWRRRLHERHSLQGRLARIAPQARCDPMDLGNSAFQLFRFSLADARGAPPR